MGVSAAKAQEELSRSIIQLLLKEPFFGHLLGGVVRTASTATPTAAVALTNEGMQLRVNPDFFCKELTRKDERIAVVKHEALHLLFKHVFRMKDGKHRDPYMFNIACDLVVNQFVKPWKLPDSAVTLETFPDMELLPDQTADWYYDKLRKLQHEIEKAGGGECSACGGTGKQGDGGDSRKPGEGEGGEGGSEGQEDCPVCGGCGHGQGGKDYDKTSAPQSAATLDRMLSSRPSWHSDHGAWGERSGVSDGIEKAIETEVERIVVHAEDRTGPRQWGNLPGRIKQLVETILEKRKPKVDWRRALRIFAASSKRTRIVSTQKKESKRYAEFAGWIRHGQKQEERTTNQQRVVQGIKVKRFQKLAVIVDTSGSVADAEVELFFSEIHGMWRQGAEVTVIECDAAVQHVWEYKGKLPSVLHGRGGTAFDPAFQWMREQKTIRWDGCIYLTDGGAPAPEIKPPCKMMWIVTADGWVGEHLRYGRAVKLPPA